MAYIYSGISKGIQLLIENPQYALIFVGIILITRFIYLNSDDIYDKIKEFASKLIAKNKK